MDFKEKFAYAQMGKCLAVLAEASELLKKIGVRSLRESVEWLGTDAESISTELREIYDRLDRTENKLMDLYEKGYLTKKLVELFLQKIDKDLRDANDVLLNVPWFKQLQPSGTQRAAQELYNKIVGLKNTIVHFATLPNATKDGKPEVPKFEVINIVRNPIAQKKLI